MAERRGNRVESGTDVQIAEQHGADDRDADGAAESFAGAEGGAGRAGVLLGYAGEHEVLDWGDHHPAAEPGEQDGSDETPVA